MPSYTAGVVMAAPELTCTCQPVAVLAAAGATRLVT